MGLQGEEVFDDILILPGIDVTCYICAGTRTQKTTCVMGIWDCGNVGGSLYGLPTLAPLRCKSISKSGPLLGSTKDLSDGIQVRFVVKS